MNKAVELTGLTRWPKALNVLLTVALLLPLMVMAPAPAAEETPRAQPVLLAMAAERPEETLRVIVQKSVQDASVEDLVPGLGGVITRDLYMINGFAAELPAKAVPALARAAGVRWVSLDAPMVLMTAGYANNWGDYRVELTQLLEANQLVVEHRFFGNSRPYPLDWSLLDIRQAAADHHRIVQDIGPIVQSSAN